MQLKQIRDLQQQNLVQIQDKIEKEREVMKAQKDEQNKNFEAIIAAVQQQIKDMQSISPPTTQTLQEIAKL